MEKTSWVLLTVLLLENLFVGIVIMIYINKDCRKCKKPKTIARALNKTCDKCSSNGDKDEKKKDKYSF
jgi:hypothetical protein